MSRIRIYTIQQLNQYTRDKVNRHFDARIDLELSENSEKHIIWDTTVGAVYSGNGIPYMRIHEVDNLQRSVYASQIEMTAYEWTWLMENPTADLITSHDVILPICGNILCCNPTHMKLFKDGQPFTELERIKKELK